MRNIIGTLLGMAGIIVMSTMLILNFLGLIDVLSIKELIATLSCGFIGLLLLSFSQEKEEEM